MAINSLVWLKYPNDMTIEKYKESGIKIPNEIVVFNNDTLKQSDRVTMSAFEVPKKIVIEYNQNSKAIPSWHEKKFLEICFMMYPSIILYMDF